MRTYSRKKVEYQLIEGVKELCRLCLGKANEFVPIFTDDSEVCAALPMRIMICVGLEMVREDCLPNIICQTCYKELERYYSFRKKCEVTYQKLKAHMLAVKEHDVNKSKRQNKSRDSTLEQNVEFHLQNGGGDGQLVLALNDNEQLELVNVVGINGVVQICEKQGDQSDSKVLHQTTENEIQNHSSNQELQQGIGNQIQHQVNLSNQVSQQSIENEIQMQDISTTSQAQSATEVVDMSQLLPSILIRLGILSQQGGLLELMDRDFREVELEGRDGERMVLELVEEDNHTSASIPPTVEEATSPEDGQNLVMETTEVEAPAVEASQPKKKPKTPARVATGTAQPTKEAPHPKALSGLWCETCGKVFSTRSVLARHKRSHSAERPHACAVCGRAFTQRSVLTRHELVHSADRPFKCGSCPKSFTQRAALAAHSRSHAPPHQRPLALHLCGSCPKVFLYPSGLSRHMSVHDGRVFTCDDCGKEFKDKSALKRHVRTAGAHARGAGDGGFRSKRKS